MHNIRIYKWSIGLVICLFYCEDHLFGESQNCVTHKTMFDQAAMVTVCQPVKIDF